MHGLTAAVRAGPRIAALRREPPLADRALDRLMLDPAASA